MRREASRDCCGIYIQALAVELEKTEAEDLVEEVCKEVGRKWLEERRVLWDT